MTTQHSNKKNRRGYAIAATLVAGMAASVMVSTALVKGTSTADDIAVRIAAKQFSGAFKRARAVAVKSGRTAEIRIEGTRVWVEVDTTAAGTGERSRVGKVVDLGFTGVTVEASTTSLCFDSSGTGHVRGPCSMAGATIEFSKGTSARTVATTVIGLISQ